MAVKMLAKNGTGAVGDFTFTGFTGQMTDLNGVYQKTKNENHGRPVYEIKRSEQEVCIYFWDGRDGPQLEGWWVAPEVGGQNVWAMNPAPQAPEPPHNGWKVPWHGDVDMSVVWERVTPAMLAQANGGAAPAPMSTGVKRTAEQAWGGAATGFNAQQANGAKTARWTQPGGAQQGGQYGAQGAQQQGAQQQQAGQAQQQQWQSQGQSATAALYGQGGRGAVSAPQPAARAQQAGKGGPQGQAGQQQSWGKGNTTNAWGTNNKAGGQWEGGEWGQTAGQNKAAAEERARAQKEALAAKQEEQRLAREAEQQRRTEEKFKNAVTNMQTTVAAAEKKATDAKASPHAKALVGSAGKTDLSPSQLREHLTEMDKLIRGALTGLTAAKGQVAQQLTQIEKLEMTPQLKQLHTALSSMQQRCERATDSTKALEGQKNEKEVLIWSQLGEAVLDECRGQVEDAEKKVEVVKDAAALLTSDLADHLQPEETLKATGETDEAVKRASMQLQSTQKMMQQKQKELTSCPKKVQETLTQLLKKLTPLNCEVAQLRKISSDASRKASQQLETKKRKIAEAKKQKKLKRNTEWNKQLVEDLSIECITAQLALQMSTFAESEALVQKVQKTFNDYVKKPCLPNTKQALQKYQESIQCLQDEVEGKKRCVFKGEAELRVAAALQTYMVTNNRKSGDIFRMLVRNGTELTQKGFQMFSKNALKQVQADQIAEAWARVDVARTGGKGHLTQEEFLSMTDMYLEVLQPLAITENENMTEHEEDVVALSLPVGRHVKLLEVGKSLGGGEAVVRVKVQDCTDEEQIGWVTIFDQQLLCKPCLFYKCVKETVLTEGADLKGVKVVRRVKKEEIVRFLAPATKVCPGRVKVQTLADSKVGYITAVNMDTKQAYLAHEEIEEEAEEKEKAETVRVALGEEIEAQLTKNDEWYPAAVVSMAEKGGVIISWEEDESESTVPITQIRTRGENPKSVEILVLNSDLEQKIIDRCEQLMNKVAEAELALQKPDTEKEEQLASVREFMETQEKNIYVACVKQQEYLEEVQTFLLNREVQNRVHKEVLTMIVSRINNVQRDLNERRLSLKTEIEETIADVDEEKAQKQAAIEEARQAELKAEREEKLAKAKDMVEAIVAEFQEIRTKAESVDYEAEKDPMKFIEQLKGKIEQAEKKLADTKSAIMEGIEEMTDADFSTGDMKMQYMKFLGRLRKLNEEPVDVNDMQLRFMTLDREELLAQVVEVLGSKEKTLEELFATLSDGKEFVTREKLHTMFNTNQPLPEKLDLETFRLTLGDFRYAAHNCTLTSQCSIAKSTIIKNVEPFDVFCVLTPEPERDSATMSERNKVQMKDSEEIGWITCEQKDVKICRKLPTQYTIKAQTVLTDKPDLNQLKVIKRLKVGEKVTPISLPHAWKQLIRVKGKCSDDTEGWFTVVDKQKKATFVDELTIE